MPISLIKKTQLDPNVADLVRQYGSGFFVPIQLTGQFITDILSGKSNVGHTHVITDVTGLQTALDGKANTSHTHSISNINDLQPALDRKANEFILIASNGNIPVVASGRYLNTANATFIDPPTGAYYDFYEVVVAGGTATIGGVGYGTSSQRILRRYVAGTWSTAPQAFTQNLTLNGTDNVAANQNATSKSSLMTRSLVGDEAFFNICKVFNSLPVPSTNVIGGTASVNTNGNYVNLSISSGSAASSYARASLARNLTSVWDRYGAANGIDFSKRLGFMIKGGFKGDFSCSTNKTVCRVYIGGNGAVPATSNSNALADVGFGVEIWCLDVTCDSDPFVQARLFCHDGTTYKTGDFINLPFIPDDVNLAFSGTLGVVSDGVGNVSLYAGLGLNRPTVIQTINGGPVTQGNPSLNWLDASVVNSSTATADTTAILAITDVRILAGSS
jgi:hypothetical protein